MALDDFARKAEDALHGDKAEQVSDSIIDKAREAAKKVTGGGFDEKIDEAADTAAKAPGDACSCVGAGPRPAGCGPSLIPPASPDAASTPRRCRRRSSPRMRGPAPAAAPGTVHRPGHVSGRYAPSPSPAM